MGIRAGLRRDVRMGLFAGHTDDSQLSHEQQEPGGQAGWSSTQTTTTTAPATQTTTATQPSLAEASTSTHQAQAEGQSESQGYADPFLASLLTQRDNLLDTRKELEDAKKTYREKKVEFRRVKEETRRRAASARERTRNARFVGVGGAGIGGGSSVSLPLHLDTRSAGIGEAPLRNAPRDGETVNGCEVTGVTSQTPGQEERERNVAAAEESSSDDEQQPEMPGPSIPVFSHESTQRFGESAAMDTASVNPQLDSHEPIIPFVSHHGRRSRHRFGTVDTDPTATPASLRRVTEEARIRSSIIQTLENMGYATSTHPHLMPMIMREIRRASFNRAVPNSALNEEEILQRVINEFYGDVLSRPSSAAGINISGIGTETPNLRRWGTWHGNGFGNEDARWVRMPGGLEN